MLLIKGVPELAPEVAVLGFIVMLPEIPAVSKVMDCKPDATLVTVTGFMIVEVSVVVGS